jgi:phage tail sheath protein FI
VIRSRVRTRVGVLVPGAALVLAVVVSATLALNGGLVGAIAHAQPATPGKTTAELDGFAPVVQLPTDVPLFIGAGTSANSGHTTLTTDVPDFLRQVSSPSPRLRAAVEAFFEQGGTAAFVLTTPTEDAAGFIAALASITPKQPPQVPVGWAMIVLPALGSLADSDWLTVARAATATASANRAIALLDPPDAAVAAAQTAGAAPLTSVAHQLTSSISRTAGAVLVSSGFSGPGAPVPGAAVLAGIIADSDSTVGTWSSPGGLAYPVAGGLEPALVVDDGLSDALVAANIDSWRVVPGTGTIMLGTRTLARTVANWISVTRTTISITRSIQVSLQPFVFAANDSATWSAVTEMISDRLRRTHHVLTKFAPVA